MAGNRVARIRGGAGGKCGGGCQDKKAWQSLEEKRLFNLIFFFFFSSTKCLHALALNSQLVGSQEAPQSPVVLRELQLYEMGGKMEFV